MHETFLYIFISKFIVGCVQFHTRSVKEWTPTCWGVSYIVLTLRNFVKFHLCSPRFRIIGRKNEKYRISENLLYLTWLFLCQISEKKYLKGQISESEYLQISENWLKEKENIGIMVKKRLKRYRNIGKISEGASKIAVRICTCFRSLYKTERDILFVIVVYQDFMSSIAVLLHLTWSYFASIARFSSQPCS